EGERAFRPHEAGVRPVLGGVGKDDRIVHARVQLQPAEAGRRVRNSCRVAGKQDPGPDVTAGGAERIGARETDPVAVSIQDVDLVGRPSQPPERSAYLGASPGAGRGEVPFARLGRERGPLVAAQRFDGRPERQVSLDGGLADVARDAEGENVAEQPAANADGQVLVACVRLVRARPAHVSPTRAWSAWDRRVLAHDDVSIVWVEISWTRKGKIVSLASAHERVDASVERKGPAVLFDQRDLGCGGAAPKHATI